MSRHTSIIWGTRTIDDQRLEQYINSVVKHLKGRGLTSKDRIVLIENNSIEFIIILLALWRMGVVACPLNPKWPYETLLQCTLSLNPKVVLCSDKRFESYKKIPIPIITLNELISFDARNAPPSVPPELPLDQEATIIWTSGSSSQPKAAVHTWGNHVYSAKGSQQEIPLEKGDRWVLSLPLHHVSGISIVCRCFLAQAAIVVMGEEELIQVIRRHKPTHISLVATQLYRLIEHKDNHEALKSLKYILLGGSSIPYGLIEKALALNLPIYLSYGLTEMSSQVATSKVDDIKHLGAKVLPYRQLMIDSNGQILVKGEVLFKGYLNQNKITLPLNNDGWFETRDRGVIKNEYLTILGRIDNMFICAGENIQPEEIESVLMKSPQVKEAIVIAKEDPEYGNRPVAFVRTFGPFNEHYLRDYCIQYLPKIKVPVSFHSWPQDLNQGLKISRKFFQERIEKL